MPIYPAAFSSSNAPNPCQNMPFATPVWGMGFVTLTSGMPVGLAVGATLGFGVAAGDVDGVGDGVDDVASFGWFTMSFSPLTVPVSLTVSVYLVRFTR